MSESEKSVDSGAEMVGTVIGFFIGIPMFFFGLLWASWLVDRIYMAFLFPLTNVAVTVFQVFSLLLIKSIVFYGGHKNTINHKTSLLTIWIIYIVATLFVWWYC